MTCYTELSLKCYIELCITLDVGPFFFTKAVHTVLYRARYWLAYVLYGAAYKGSDRVGYDAEHIVLYTDVYKVSVQMLFIELYKGIRKLFYTEQCIDVDTGLDIERNISLHTEKEDNYNKYRERKLRER